MLQIVACSEGNATALSVTFSPAKVIMILTEASSHSEQEELWRSVIVPISKAE